MALNQDSINILIVDDEKRACTNLKNLLLSYVDAALNIVGIAHDTREAEALITQLQPDAVFLDIEMPNENAFRFLDRIGPVNFEVIFVTAYDEYALRAFKLNAVDYILKPISIDELKGAVQKLKERILYKSIKDLTEASYTELSDQVLNKQKPHKITLKDTGMMEVVDFKDIYYIEAQSSYSKVVFARQGKMKEVIMSKPLSDYEELLPDDLFFRIHRAYLINCMQVQGLSTDDTNAVILKNDITLPVSRRRHTPLLEFLKNGQYYNG